MAKGKSVEQLFVSFAVSAGFVVEPPRPIRIKTPVENRNGLLTKTVTLPDAYVIDPQSQRTAHVEVTNGCGCNEHKEAQMRVVEAAGVSNYYVLTGNQVRELGIIPEIDRYAAICDIFGWPL